MGSTGGSTAADPPMSSLVGEAAVLLKSLRALSLKAVRLKFLDGVGEKQATEAFGLLDGGATHPLRTARPGELDHAVQSGECGASSWFCDPSPG